MHQKQQYIPGIDGLRALAVLSVIIFHVRATLLPGGFTGVDVFFVISGYVVSGSLAKEERQAGFLHFTLGFYARRILRIYPALVVCLIAAGILQTLFVPSSWLSTTANKTAIFAFFGLSNFALTWFDDGYFSPRTEFNTFTHTWSLALEEQFYLIFPTIFFAWLTWRDRKDVLGTASTWALPLLATLSLLFSAYQTSSAPEHAYYWIPSRFWELACGAMLFTLHATDQLSAKSELQKNGSILIGLILIGLGFWLADEKAFPFPWALLSVAGTLFVIGGVAIDARIGASMERLLANRLIVYIGKISYSLYLWHWPVVVLFRWTLGLEKPLYVALAIAITGLVSVFSFHVIERPIRRNKRLISKADSYIVARGVITISACAVLVLGIFKAQPYLGLSITKDKWNWYPDSWPVESTKLDTKSPGFRGRTIFVLGDSHAGAYDTMLQMLADQNGVRIRQYSKGGCGVAGLVKASNSDCSENNRQVVAKVLAQASPGDVAFLASLRVNRLGDQWFTYDESEIARRETGPEVLSRRADALKEADSLISVLENAGLTVVIDAPKPVFRSPTYRCADWFNKDNPVCKGGITISRNFLLNYRRPTMESLRQLASKHPKLVVWDPFPILCPDEICTTFDNGLPVFFDGDHLSAHGNRMLYPSFVSLLTTIWPPQAFVIR